MLPDGTKFKNLEQANSPLLEPKTYTVIRLDGKNFSTFTKRFRKPYDSTFMNVMDETTKRLCETITGTHFAYTQSDEISIIFSDLANPNTQAWMGGRINKILSITAATATANFITALRWDGEGQIPVFDARLHKLANTREIAEYVRWRRADAQKNSVTMAASTLASHKKLMGMPSRERHSLLEGTPLEHLPEGFYNGRITYKEAYEAKVAELDVPAHVILPDTVTRNRWATAPATRHFADEFLNHL